MELYRTGAIRSLRDLDAVVSRAECPVILVEGTRSVPACDEPVIRAMGLLLAGRYPQVVFRTGNAKGSDTIFADAVAEVDPARLQYVVPNSGMGKARRRDGVPVVSLEKISGVTERNIDRITVDASESTERLVAAYRGVITNQRLAATGSYLLRDTLKVAGAPDQGIAPAAAGIFYVKEADPSSGGTGHTIRVCAKLRVPVILQDIWKTWLQP